TPRARCRLRGSRLLHQQRRADGHARDRQRAAGSGRRAARGGHDPVRPGLCDRRGLRNAVAAAAAARRTADDALPGRAAQHHPLVLDGAGPARLRLRAAGVDRAGPGASASGLVRLIPAASNPFHDGLTRRSPIRDRGSRSVPRAHQSLRPAAAAPETLPMLRYAVIFFVIALIAAVLGFSGVAGAATNIAWILFVVFVILAIVSLLRGKRV